MLGKYKYTPKQVEKLLNSMVILVDTREQSNFFITDYFDRKADGAIPYKSHTLKFGDYSFMLPSCVELGRMEDEYFTNRIVIERKNSLLELSNNLGNDRERFERELSRAKEVKATFSLMIEDGSYSDILFHQYGGEYDNLSKFLPKPFIATLATFRARYSIHVDYVKKNCAGNFMYYLFYYWLRCYLKGELPYDS